MRRTSKESQPTASDKRPRVGSLVQNAAALMISSAGTAVLGLAFWVIAAHITSAKFIGRASAEIAAMTLLATLAQLSFGPIFERFLPIAGTRTRNFVKRAYALCLAVALIAAVVYLSVGFGHNFIPPSFGARALFVVAVVLWTIFVLQDWVLTSLRAARWVPVENILFALAKLALLPALLAVTAIQGIFLAWSLPVIAAVGAVTWYLFRKCIPRHEASSPSSENLPSIREIILLAIVRAVRHRGSHCLVVVANRADRDTAPGSCNRGPLLPDQHLSRTAWPYFSGASNLHFWSRLHRSRTCCAKNANTAIRVAIVVLVPSIAIGVIFAPEILRLFGATYAADGTTLLRMLLLSLPGTAVTAFYAAFAWLDKRGLVVGGTRILTAVIYFGLLFLFIGHFGILSIGIASLVTSGIAGIFFLPISIKRYRMTCDIDAPRSAPSPPQSLAPEQ